MQKVSHRIAMKLKIASFVITTIDLIMNRFFTLILTILIIIGCNKEESKRPLKFLTYVIGYTGDTLIFFHYEGNELKRVTNSYNVPNEYIYEDGRIIKQVYLEPLTIVYNYVYNSAVTFRSCNRVVDF